MGTLQSGFRNYHPVRTKSILKRILRASDSFLSQRAILGSHSPTLARIYTPYIDHPILMKSGRTYEQLISWMIGATVAGADKSNQQRFENSDPRCRLCESESEESRKHLLTDCAATAHLIADYATDTVKMYAKHRELVNLSHEERWLWILGGGFLKPAFHPDSSRLKRSPFMRGESCSQGIDKSNLADCSTAYFQFREIESRIPRNSYIIYTDGSVSNKIAGAGYVIYNNGSKFKERQLPLGKYTISFAELEAVRRALEDLRYTDNFRHSQEQKQEQKEEIGIHIFTDSQFTQNILCSNNISPTHFYLVEEIKNLAATFSNSSFKIHWIPSHIEHTEFGKMPIEGSVRADWLANAAREVWDHDNVYENDVSLMRHILLESSAQLISKIDSLLLNLRPNDGPSSDDFRSTDAMRVLSKRKKP